MSSLVNAIGSVASAASQQLTSASASTLARTAARPTSGSEAVSGAQPFSSLLSDTVSQVDALETSARSAADGLMTGSGVDVHEAMIAAQKAELAFEMSLAVRNKAVQAYQQVMSMQF